MSTALDRGINKRVPSVSDLAQALELATDPAEIVKIESLLEGIETTMRRSGLYSTAEIRPVNETRMWARWKLGRALAQVERGIGPGRGKKVSSGLTPLLKRLGQTRQTANMAQRIGTLPKEELKKTLAKARESDDLITLGELVILARPFWYQEKRTAKHKAIVREAKQKQKEVPDSVGPFSLLYADPPWIFETYTPDKTHRTPDDHYPTLSDEEIINFKIGKQKIADLATKNCALFLWCTSSNLVRALAVMDGWGFEYRTHAVWDKVKIGLGLVFRNQHEVLLYCVRGNPPKPIKLFSSVFRYPRTRHSAKPPEVRKALEIMYPFWKEQNRAELFCRGTIEGWTSYGFEANRQAAA